MRVNVRAERICLFGEFQRRAGQRSAICCRQGKSPHGPAQHRRPVNTTTVRKSGADTRVWREQLIKKGGKRVERSLLNEEIRVSNVRLVGADGGQRGIVSRDEALAEARAAGLDLVMVAPDAEPPVCKVMDYGKHLFELKKTKAAQRKKQKQTQVKEMKFRPGTEEGDYQVKLRNLKRFLEEGDKAKVSLRFRGREVVHPEIGMQLMTRIAEDLDELGQIEAEPKFEGRQVIMVLAPKKKKG